MRNFVLIVFTCLILITFPGCTNTGNQTNTKDTTTKQETSKPKTVFSNLAGSVFEIQTYDGNRILETGKCFLVTQSTLVAPFSLFKGATRAEITPLNGNVKTEIKKYYALDRINNLILLEADNLAANPLKLYGASTTQGVKTIVIGKKQNNTQPLYTGSCLQEKVIQGRRLFSISNVIGKKSQGVPIFVSNGSVLGVGISEEVMYKRQNFAIPAVEILNLLNKMDEGKLLASIGMPNAKRNASIKRIVLETDYGDIVIKLYNETPTYRDNFVELVEEGFYDSLLIHRVIRDFGIQMGAADTRHAKADDIVGWKGPGYNLPAHIVTGLYHKRGAIGSPRKPDDKNKQRRSDGSQFYIVTGRKYLENELDEIEKENGITFTPKQRQVYKTVGGAPHLDDSYTVFGEVVSGLDVADRITLMPVKGDFRPIKDIRLKKVSIEY